MTFTHADIRDRLVDYLYGQLEDEARAAFQAHVEACPACRAQVTGVERARVLAREVVRRPLADPVPDGAREKAFEAARAAVAARAAAATGRPHVATGVAVAAGSRPAAEAPPSGAPAAPASPGAEGWLVRLRRRWTWTFPTFATVAAVAVFVLVRATIFREARTPVSAERVRELANPPTAPGAGHSRDQGPPPGPPPPFAGQAVEGSAGQDQEDGAGPGAEKDKDKKDKNDNRTAPSPVTSSRSDGAARGQLQRAPAAGGARHRNQPPAGARSPSSASREAVPAKPAAPTGPAPSLRPSPVASPRRAEVRDEEGLDRAVDEDRARARAGEPTGAARPPSVTSNAQRAAPQATTKSASSRAPLDGPPRDFAVPPPPAAAASAPRAAQGRAAPMEMQQDDADLGQAPPAAMAMEKKSGQKTKAPSASAAAPRTPSADRAPGAASAAGTGAPAPDPALVRGRRAESLMNQRRWPEAIAILRDLLRRYPLHEAAPRWRALLAAAQAGLDAPEEMFATPPPPR